MSRKQNNITRGLPGNFGVRHFGHNLTCLRDVGGTLTTRNTRICMCITIIR